MARRPLTRGGVLCLCRDEEAVADRLDLAALEALELRAHDPWWASGRSRQRRSPTPAARLVDSTMSDVFAVLVEEPDRAEATLRRLFSR